MRFRDQIYVTPRQYDNLLNARDNWPKKLTCGVGLEDDSSEGCTVVYLAQNSGVSNEAIKNSFFYSSIGISKKSAEIVEEVYGIDEDLQEDIAHLNDYLKTSRFFENRSRAKKMKRVFNNLIDNVETVKPKEVVPERLEERVIEDAVQC